jgi:hypothetical protein
MPQSAPVSSAARACRLKRRISSTPFTKLGRKRLRAWAKTVCSPSPAHSICPSRSEKPKDMSDHFVGTPRCSKSPQRLG